MPIVCLPPRQGQDHQKCLGVFAFGLPNAERRWLGLGYPVTRANQSRESGLRIELGGSGKSLAYAPQRHLSLFNAM